MKKSSNSMKKSLREKMLLGFIQTAIALLLFQMQVNANEIYDYVIITTNVIYTMTIPGDTVLNPFIVYKEKMGFSVRTITETTERPGVGTREGGGYGTEDSTQRAENIRNWLKEHYQEYGIKYVLLIGYQHPWVKPTIDTIHPSDPTILIEGPLREDIFSVPMKVCYRQNNKYYLSATDYYFAELTGNWDSDGDGLFGEFYHDFSWTNDSNSMDLFLKFS